MIPKYKVETYTAAVLDHTITSDALEIHTKEVLTDAVGNFAIVLPAKKADAVYGDIALADKVKVYFGYDTVSATPSFIGKVTNITSPLTVDSGYVRVISGLSQGEILLRRHKTDTRYTGTNASTIVTEWATDLGLGAGDITADVNQPDIEVQTKTYFDLLREISDYWIDGANQIKKDFYVDVDFDLVWKVRPIRTAGVETVTVGENLLNYTVAQAVNSVANNITVYGAALKTYPTDAYGDDLTEQTAAETPADDGWTALTSTLSWNADSVVQNESLQVTKAATTSVYIENDFPGETALDCSGWKKNSYSFLDFWMKVTSDPDAGVGIKSVELYAPNVGNRLLLGLFKFVPTLNNWHHVNVTLGPDSKEPWQTVAGTPSWADVQSLFFHFDTINNGVITFRVDGLHFGGCRYSGTAANIVGDQRDLEMMDDKLKSDTSCGQRAETLLYQRETAPTQIDLVLRGNGNVLVGDRLSLTIPNEGISAVDYDVMSVEHTFIKGESGGWTTTASTVNTANIREPIIQNPQALLGNVYRKVRQGIIGERVL